MRTSHAQTRPTVRVALVFVVAALLAAAAGERWLALHLFLAGAVVLAISGVSLMLTVTWSAAPAPPDRWVVLQRAAVAVGAAGVGLGRTVDGLDAVVGVAGATYAAGLVGLAVLIGRTVRQGVERRFDVAAASYVAAAAAGLAGVGIGVWMAVDAPTLALRSAHAVVNVLGLVGLVVGGTLPFFAATVGRAKMARRATPRRMAVALAWRGAMVVVVVVALVADAGTVAALGLVGYAAGVVAALALMPTPTRRQLTWSGPRLLALWAGAAWWAGATVSCAFDAHAGRPVLAGRWLEVMVVAGYAQILWGSLAYLLPMLRGGGHQRLGEGFATTRSWPGLVAANAAGAALALTWTPVAVVAVAAWALDSAWRAARVGTTRAERPDAG